MLFFSLPKKYFIFYILKYLYEKLKLLNYTKFIRIYTWIIKYTPFFFCRIIKILIRRKIEIIMTAKQLIIKKNVLQLDLNYIENNDLFKTNRFSEKLSFILITNQLI